MPAGFSQIEWDEFCVSIRDAMRKRAQGYTTPLAASEDADWGEALGTGNYVRIHGQAYVLTNEHVAREAAGKSITHLPKNDDFYVRCGDFGAVGWPEDVALAKVQSQLLADREIIDIRMFEQSYAAVAGELLFWIGVPGSTAERNDPITEKVRRRSVFGTLSTSSIPMVSQEWIDLDTSGIANYLSGTHVAVHYPLSAFRNPGEGPTPLPNPAGMSGSLLWDTKAVRSLMHGEPWSASKAMVCGLIWGTTANPPAVYATRIEHARPAIDFIIDQLP